ncbi:MAG: YqcC family protein [Chitinophagaceae bacterium]
MAEVELITEKIYGVRDEMKSAGLWKKHLPDWVSDFQKTVIYTEHDFSEWLQFVYLPNLLQQAGNNLTFREKRNIVPQAMKFFGEDVKKGKLLQLLIELDSLS